MSRVLPFLLGAASVVSVAAASAPLSRSVIASAPVRGLAADGSLTAFAVGARAHDCRHVVLWNRAAGSAARLGRAKPCGEVTSTGSGLVGPSLAGTRALWLSYAGGNIREWALLSGTAANRTPKQIRFIARDVDGPGPVVLGEGDSSKFGYLLPYAVDSKLYALRADGRSILYLTASARIVAVAAKGGELAAALETGPVVILEGPNRIVRTESFAGKVDAVRITGYALVAQQGRILALRAGGAHRAWTLPPGAKLADAEGSLAVYVRGKEVRLLSLTTGKDILFHRAATAPLAQLEPGGLVYAVGRKITFVPAAQLAARLR